MAYRAIEPIIEDELEIDNDLLRFYYRVIQALTENRIDVIDDDLLQKLVEVRRKIPKRYEPMDTTGQTK